MKSSTRGTVTVFVAVIMIPVCVLQCALVDFARGISFRYIGQERVQLALNSLLASFDSRLQDDYGLFGVNRVRVGNLEDTFRWYLNGSDFPVEEFQLQLKEPLSSADVLGKQITDRMQLRTPVRGGQWFLERLGLIEQAEEQGRAALILAEGNEILRLSEDKLGQLKQLLEGMFPGDTLCVNGYTKAHWLYTERETILVTVELPDWEDGELMERLRTSYEEYRSLLLIYCEYHNKSIGIIRELQDLAGQIRGLITEARNLCEEDAGVISMIGTLRRQADKISNGRNLAALENNLQLLTGKVASVEWNLQMLNDLETYLSEAGNIDTFINHNRNLFSMSGIRDDFRADLLETDSAEGAAQLPEGDWTLPTAGNSDFEIPKKIYDTLPSVTQGVEASGICDWIDFQDLSALTSFFGAESFLSGIAQVGSRLVEDLYLNDYIVDTFCHSQETNGYFTGEIEYILGGHASSKENEDYVKQKLFFLRFVLNLTHVLADGEKRGLAQELGYAIALAVSRGIGGDLYAVLIMCTWAACESGVDVSDLFAGECVPLVKSKESWKTSIEGLASASTEAETEGKFDLSYEEYLMLLLMTESRETKLLRIADVIEVNMTEKTGLRYKLSGVYACAEAKVAYSPDYWTINSLPGRRNEKYVLWIQGRQSY